MSARQLADDTPQEREAYVPFLKFSETRVCK
jgi:hypothetical protein